MRSHIPGVLVRKCTKYSFQELDAPSLLLFVKYCKGAARLDNNGLWVNSLCINQQDNEEKSEQIQLMRDIYVMQCEFWYGYGLWMMLI